MAGYKEVFKNNWKKQYSSDELYKSANALNAMLLQDVFKILL
jgi:hypothetical protein